MEYQIMCECGRRMAVTAGAAGSRLPCPCGHSVEVPSLRELRRRSGEAETDNPVLMIKQMVAARQLPPDPACTCCGRPDAATMQVVAECERKWVRRRGRWYWLLFFVSWPLALYLAASRAERPDGGVEVFGQDVIMPLPIRLCPACRTELRTPAQVAELLREVPVYARLLDRYPESEAEPADGKNLMPLPPLEDLSLPGSDGIHLHAVRAGDPCGPPVILLHGFPEFWYGWRHQIGPLAAVGFNVVALDQRGYNLSDKPPRVRDYNLDRLAADVAAAITALGVEQAAVVGHDWGGIVAWWLAVTRPERVSRLVILNAPHPVVMRRALRTDPLQMLHSWYLFFMQVPRLHEWLSRLRNWHGLVRALRKSSRPGTFTDEDFSRYREAWSQPGAFTAMVNWYRAAMRSPPAARPDVRVPVPTLVLWGARDRFIRRKYAVKSVAMCDDGRLEILEEATHWIQHEEAGRVNARVAVFLRAGSP